MFTIHKYELVVRNVPHSIIMPHGAKIVSVGQQHDGGKVLIWAEVNTSAPPVARTFQVFGTGDDIIRDGTYVDTVHSNLFGVYLVWHIYELINDLQHGPVN